jgi:CrcB protein
MSWVAWVGVAILGGVGALARFGLTLLVADRFHPHLPVRTLAVNVSGSFLLGLMAGAAVKDDARLILGAGLLGAYTTFSTWMVETQRIGEAGRRRIAVTNVVLSIVLGFAAVALGHAIGAQL